MQGDPVNNFDDPNRKLKHAIMNDDLPSVKGAILDGADVNAYFVSTYTHLYIAIQNGNIEIIKYLIANGANVDAVNGSLNWTPLHYAARYNYFDRVKLLLEAGASIDLVDTIECTAVDIAELHNYNDMANYIRSYDIPVKGVNNDNMIDNDDGYESDHHCGCYDLFDNDY